MDKSKINCSNSVLLGKKRRTVVCLFLLLVMASGLLGGCAYLQKDTDKSEVNKERLKVVTTIFPQYDFVRQIAGDKVELKMLLKPGEESHSYEPSPKDIIAIQNCDIFIYVGGENDEWVEDILDSLDTRKMKKLRLADCVKTVSEEHVEGMKEGSVKEEALKEQGMKEGNVKEEGVEDEDVKEQGVKIEHMGHVDKEEAFDEHVWTSPQNAVKIVDNITELLCDADQRNEKSFIQAKEEYVKKLRSLDEEFREVADASPRRTVLFGDRFPFRYFAEKYNLEYYAAFPGCAADNEPSAATMAFLIDKVRAERIPIVLKMELSNDNIAKAIAEATGTEVKVFYSCHNITADQFAAGETYLSMMGKNVETLREALSNGID